MTAAALTRRTDDDMDTPDEAGFTIEDLHAIPEGRLRYELIEGSLHVSPSATAGHNVIGRWIANLLEVAGQSEEYFVSTDQSVTIDGHNEVRPDIVVARVDALDVTPFPIDAAILAVEIVSPTSVTRDNETKRALYARAGVPSYWIVDPSGESTSGDDSIGLVEFALDPAKGAYRYVTHYTTHVFRTDTPWPVEIDLPAMTARLARIRGRAQSNLRRGNEA